MQQYAILFPPAQPPLLSHLDLVRRAVCELSMEGHNSPDMWNVVPPMASALLRTWAA